VRYEAVSPAAPLLEDFWRRSCDLQRREPSETDEHQRREQRIQVHKQPGPRLDVTDTEEVTGSWPRPAAAVERFSAWGCGGKSASVLVAQFRGLR